MLPTGHCRHSYWESTLGSPSKWWGVRFLSDDSSTTPAVLIHGPRQSRKTTLARTAGERLGISYFSFDDKVLADAAEADPLGFVDGPPERAILDEIQHVPGLFPSIKVAVDRRRTPGRFLLTGSANVLPVPKLAESLAGRLEIRRLHALAQCEIARRTSQFIEFIDRK